MCSVTSFLQSNCQKMIIIVKTLLSSQIKKQKKQQILLPTSLPPAVIF